MRPAILAFRLEEFSGGRSPPRARPLCRVLCEIYALREGTLPPELDDEIEDLLMPGYRERLLAACLASVPHDGSERGRG